MFKALILLIQSFYRKNKWKPHFYKKNGNARDIFLYANIFRYNFLGMADIPDIFLGMADMSYILLG